jgi:glyoxylase-like metal-dependent hydrolase (beta-lactamase superfamily II)
MNKLIITIIVIAASSAFPDSNLRVLSIKTGMSVCFGIETDSGLFLIDAGYPGYADYIIKKLNNFSKKKLELIILTHAHFDHVGDAAKIRKKTGAKIAIHESDYDDLLNGKTRVDKVRGIGILGKILLPIVKIFYGQDKIKADVLVKSGTALAEFGLPAFVLGTPGHTPGSISIIIEDTVAIVGDLIVSRPTTSSQCYYANDWDEIEASLDALKQLNLKRIYSGHSKNYITKSELMKLK